MVFILSVLWLVVNSPSPTHLVPIKFNKNYHFGPIRQLSVACIANESISYTENQAVFDPKQKFSCQIIHHRLSRPIQNILTKTP